MKRLLLTTIVAALSWPAGTVTAHTLTSDRAEMKARYEALIIAGQLASRPAIHVLGSRRVGPHMVDVRVRFRFRDKSKTCRVQRIRVRYVSSSGRRLSVGFPATATPC